MKNVLSEEDIQFIKKHPVSFLDNKNIYNKLYDHICGKTPDGITKVQTDDPSERIAARVIQWMEDKYECPPEEEEAIAKLIEKGHSCHCACWQIWSKRKCVCSCAHV